MNDVIIRKGQTYAHKNHRLYYEVEAVFDGKVHFLYYDARTNKEDRANRDLRMFENLIKDGTLIRDL